MRSASSVGLLRALIVVGILLPASALGQTPLEEVIVYAQKRPETSQSVPVAVTALNGEMIRETGIFSIEELTELSPSVSFDTAQSWQRSSLKIRGIGTYGNTRSFEGAVGVFIDGVYRSRSGMALTDLIDIDSIEILRGPQSTLFGKNTVAGTIALRSARPDQDAMSGNAELRAGELGLRYVNAGINVPLGETAAARIAYADHQRDGLFESPDTGDEYDAIDRYGLKGQILWTPRDDVELHLIADFAESDAPCCWGSAEVFNGPTSPLIETYSTLNGLTFVPAPDSENNRSQTLNEVPREWIKDSGVSLKAVWDVNDQWSIESLTAVRNWEHSQLNADPDFVPADLFLLEEPADIDWISQEVNFRYVDERIDLLLGFYYSTEDYFSMRSAATGSDADNYLNALISADLGAVACLPPVVAMDCLFPVGIAALVPDGEFTRETYQQDSDGYALFAHAETVLSDKFKLITGIRYDDIEKEGGVQNLFWYDSAIARATLAMQGIPDDGTPRNGFDIIGTFYSPSFTDKNNDSEVTGTLQLEYLLEDLGMAYGGYHRGFKAGGVNLHREGAITQTNYAPETADSFEAGVKLDYMDGQARTNIAAFYTEFSDLQINFFTGLEFRTINTGESTSKGLEIENIFQINDNWRADLSVTYLRSKFERIDDAFLSYLVGRDTPRAPRWAGSAGVRYDYDFRNGWSFFVRGLASYMGKHYVGAEVPTEEKADSYVITDANIGVTNDRWEASVWCRNCGDESYRTIFFNSTFQPGSFSAYLNDPQQFGVTLRARF